MSFTYDYESKADVARVRLAIGDTVFEAGVRPEGMNFSDEEITAVLRDVKNDTEAAAYVFLKSLANAWGTYVDITVGPRKEALSHISNHYARRADEVRRQLSLETKSFTVLLNRVDGYSQE